MPACSDTELRALLEAELLLKHAAAHVKDLDPSVARAIGKARAAAQGNKWTPRTVEEFWSAYSRLCDLIAPVTVESLRASEPRTRKQRWWHFGRTPHPRSIAERLSTLYTAWMVFLVIFVSVLQLYVWVCSSISKEIDDLVSENFGSLLSPNGAYLAVLEDWRKFDLVITEKYGVGVEDNFTDEERTRKNQIHSDLKRYGAVLEKIHHEAMLLENILNPATALQEPFVGEVDLDDWTQATDYVVGRMFAVRVQVPKIQERAHIILGILGSFILPLLFGLLGALAFTVRKLAEEIETSTFAATSPTQHRLRVGLGVLTGGVIGVFGALTQNFSLSPLAVAFLAGYGLDAVFSTFDSLIKRFQAAA